MVPMEFQELIRAAGSNEEMTMVLRDNQCLRFGPELKEQVGQSSPSAPPVSVPSW
jgi:hypothetical protein